MEKSTGAEERIRQELASCRLCPRNCKINRLAGARGRCGVSGRVKVARAALHLWEEPCISGEQGSGTVFFSGCSLGCVYCQNRAIAGGQAGKEISVGRLSEIFLELQEKGAANINLVTAGHFLGQVIDALQRAKREGLRLPVVYNSGGYEKAEALARLEGLVDIYLPDLKYVSADLAERYSGAPDYFIVASTALKEMVRQVEAAGSAAAAGKAVRGGMDAAELLQPAGTVFDENGMMKRGVIVRHLQLPGCLEDSKRVVRYLYETYGDRIYISILSQYTPLAPLTAWPELNRRVTRREYDALVDYAIGLGVENGFIQEGDTARESFIPPFDEEGV